MSASLQVDFRNLARSETLERLLARDAQRNRVLRASGARGRVVLEATHRHPQGIREVEVLVRLEAPEADVVVRRRLREASRHFLLKVARTALRIAAQEFRERIRRRRAVAAFA